MLTWKAWLVGSGGRNEQNFRFLQRTKNQILASCNEFSQDKQRAIGLLGENERTDQWSLKRASQTDGNKV